MTDNSLTPVDSPRLQRLLTAHGLAHLVGESGDIYVPLFVPGAAAPLQLTVAAENDGAVLAIRGHLQHAYPMDYAAKAQTAALSFQGDHRWPTATLRWIDGEPPTFVVAGAVHVPVLCGLADSQLDEYLHLASAAIHELTLAVHLILAAETGPDRVASVDELEAWLND